jgi:hypothetical protein
MKENVCIYRQEFIPVYINHCCFLSALKYEVNSRLMFW